MSSLFGNGYDPRGGARSQDVSDPIPDGKYQLEITKAEERDNKPKNGVVTGSHLFLELTVRSQHCGGRKVFQRFNLRNSSAEAERIGREQFNSMLDAIGMGDVIIKSPSQLLGKVFTGRVVVRDGQNEVKGFEAKGAAQAQAPAAAAAPAWQRQQAPRPTTAPAAAAGSGQVSAPDRAGESSAPGAGDGAQAAGPAEPQRPKKPWEK